MRRSICGSPPCMHMYVSLFLVLYMPADSTCLQDGIPEERRKNLAARAVDVYCGTRKKGFFFKAVFGKLLNPQPFDFHTRSSIKAQLDTP